MDGSQRPEDLNSALQFKEGNEFLQTSMEENTLSYPYSVATWMVDTLKKKKKRLFNLYNYSIAYLCHLPLGLR